MSFGCAVTDTEISVFLARHSEAQQREGGRRTCSGRSYDARSAERV